MDAQRLDLIGLQRMRTRTAALQPVQHDAEGAEIDVVDAQQSNLARAQPVIVGEQEQRAGWPRVAANITVIVAARNYPQLGSQSSRI